MMQERTDLTEEANVNHKNFIVMWNRLKGFAKENGRKFDDVNIFQDMPFSKEAREKYKSALDFYTDEDEWSTLDTYVNAYIRTKGITGNPNEFRESGRSAAKFKSVGQWRVFMKTLPSPVAAINYLPEVVPNWNKTKVFGLIEPARYIHSKRKIEAILQYTFYPHINSSSDYCSDPHILGLLEAIPENWLLPQGEARQVLAQYDPVELFSSRFFSHLKLDPVVDGNELFLRLEGIHKKVGEKVILQPTQIHGKAYYIGDSININDKNSNNYPVGVRILETVTINNEPVCEGGMILNAPYFVINYSCKQVGLLRTMGYVKNFLTSNREAIKQQIETNRRLEQEIAKNKVYQHGLEELVDERTSELRSAYETLKATTEEKRLLLLQLSEVDKLKFTQQILAKAKHELNNPLTVIRAAINRINDAYIPDTGEQNQVHDISESWGNLIKNIEKVYIAADAAKPLAEKSGLYLNEIQRILGGGTIDKSTLSGLAKALSGIKGAEISGLDTIIEKSLAEMENFTGMVDKTIKRGGNEDVISGISTIKREITNMGSVINIIAEYAKVGRYKPGNEIIDLTSFLSDYNTRYKTKFESKGVNFNIVGKPGCVVMADQAQLYEVFDNLLNNAIEAMEGRKIRSLQVSVSENEVSRGINYAQIEVKDTGKGFDQNDKNDIFLPFRTTKDSKLSGLGLGIVKSIISTNRGFIECESTPNVGSSFYVSLPIYTGETK